MFVLELKLPQRGISGSYQSGADAIIVSGKRCGWDSIQNLKYVAEWRIGANSLVMSFLKNSLLRVFRSSKYIRRYNLGETSMDVGAGRSSTYRYDGLYKIVYFQAPIRKSIIPHLFYFSRLNCLPCNQIRLFPPLRDAHLNWQIPSEPLSSIYNALSACFFRSYHSMTQQMSFSDFPGKGNVQRNVSFKLAMYGSERNWLKKLGPRTFHGEMEQRVVLLHTFCDISAISINQQ